MMTEDDRLLTLRKKIEDLRRLSQDSREFVGETDQSNLESSASSVPSLDPRFSEETVQSLTNYIREAHNHLRILSKENFSLSRENRRILQELQRLKNLENHSNSIKNQLDEVSTLLEETVREYKEDMEVRLQESLADLEEENARFREENEKLSLKLDQSENIFHETEKKVKTMFNELIEVHPDSFQPTLDAQEVFSLSKMLEILGKQWSDLASQSFQLQDIQTAHEIELAKERAEKKKALADYEYNCGRLQSVEEERDYIELELGKTKEKLMGWEETVNNAKTNMLKMAAKTNSLLSFIDQLVEMDMSTKLAFRIFRAIIESTDEKTSIAALAEKSGLTSLKVYTELKSLREKGIIKLEEPDRPAGSFSDFVVSTVLDNEE